MHLETDPAGRSILTPALNVLSLLYKSAAFIQRRRRSRSVSAYPSLFIVSVDNLSFGGTGKTPLIMAIGGALQERGIPFVVVARGYRSKFENSGAVVSAAHRVDEVGDEAFLLKLYFPNADILVGKNRKHSLSIAVESGKRIVILDDGFQSTDIQKDFRIMLVDPEQPYFFLRHFRFLVRETDCLLFHRRIPDKFAATAQGTYSFRIKEFINPQGNPVKIDDKRVFAFSALANNQRFFSDLAVFHLLGTRPFPDHHHFCEPDIHRLETLRLKSGADFLVCSEKDFIKLKTLPIGKLPFLYTRNEIQLDTDITGKIVTHAKKKGRL